MKDRFDIIEHASVGDIVPFDILEGEVVEVWGRTIVGVGLVSMRSVYPASMLTEACGPTDTCWGAKVLK